MFKVLVTISVIVSGIAAFDTCDDSVNKVCIKGNPPTKFPESKEDLQELCEFAIPYYECAVDYGEKCQRNEYFQDEHKQFLELSNEACDEDTLLHAAVVNNLKCFSELAKELEEDDECFTESLTASHATLQRYAEKLKDDGLLELSDDEEELRETYECLAILKELACYTTKVEKKCGTIAMDTYVEILLKIAPKCGRTHGVLPAVIRLYRLEKEEENVVANIFKNRE